MSSFFPVTDHYIDKENDNIDPMDQINLLADAMPQLVWIAKPNGEVVYYNNRVSDFSGAYKDESGKWSWEGLLHPDDKIPTEQAWTEAIRTGGIYEKEHRVKMKDGSYCWHLSRAFPQKDQHGNILRWMGTATDIDEQKQVEQKIKEAEERWRTALESTEMGTWEYDPTHKTFFLSDVAKKIRGIGPEFDKPFEIHRETIFPEDVQMVIDAMEDALKKGEENVFQVAYRVYKKGHEELYWIRSIGKVICDKDKKPQRVIGIMQDITAQKAAEEKLQYLATLTQNIADAVIGTDLEQKITNWNKGAEDLYGWKKEEIMGKNADVLLQTEFISQGDRETWEYEFNTTGHWDGEVHQKHKDGHQLIIMVSVARMKDAKGVYIGAVAVNKDVTEQRKAAQLLKESESRFRVLTNTIPQIVWVSSAEGHMEYLNDQWYRSTGQPVSEALQNRIEMMHPGDVQIMSEKWEKALREGRPFIAEYRLKNRVTGNYRWFFCNIQPLRNDEGKILKWIGASTDIQHFKDISVLLEQQVQERTLELEKLNKTLLDKAEELRRSNEDLQQFAHVASHDLKEPLRKIKTYGSRLVEEYGDMLPAKAKSYLDKMESAATRMNSMIDGVLGYSMLGATEQVIETIDLNDLLDNIQNDLEILVEQKQAIIEYENLPAIEGSSILLYQLFYNLINNSLKFSVSGIQPRICISCSDYNVAQVKENSPLKPGIQYQRISVSDNGIGFEQAYAQKIFKTFTRLNAKDKYEGTGLGLSLCKKIVERHNGTIEAEGKLNEGAVFIIVLPQQQPIKYA
ncbi:PAS domain-containing sensor histidine kinase [Flavisolibacter ginsengisoli]|jgi:PAS domain S-box-containing protein|uniref:histidine kinase n=1 Tax=Flavisolibacter ginsengisoli DSM 18119 TaxID=1121884 RepID=A0A1M4ZUY1_9BACT|nr:PAS domain S-box protein [Flavisolibacter ginsengisoli]SHF21838.1 His Kinase A (phospho-acceptor) domain-containing protein [Flavisolibacter ginsengisoli DSM 18119]